MDCVTNDAEKTVLLDGVAGQTVLTQCCNRVSAVGQKVLMLHNSVVAVQKLLVSVLKCCSIDFDVDAAEDSDGVPQKALLMCNNNGVIPVAVTLK